MYNNNMEILITKGVGHGKTLLSAFDAALWDAGVANQNLIYLSSVIPPDSKVIRKKLKNNNKYGQKLYCVMANKRINEIGREAWAGIGWMQSEDGKGLFVEHTGSTEGEVRRLIKQSLYDMKKYRKEKFGRVSYAVSGINCETDPVCTLVCAVYQIEDWN